eukprot:gene28945-35960_t
MYYIRAFGLIVVPLLAALLCDCMEPVDLMKESFTKTENGTAEYSLPETVTRGIASFFKATDGDGNKELNFTEFRDLMREFFRDGDESTREALQEATAAQLLYYEMDSNGDERLSYEEVEAALVEWVNV